jgi:hypothetical protein
MGERNRSRSRLVILIVEALLKFLPSPGQPRAVRYGIAVVLVAVFFVFSLAAGIAVGPFEFLFLILPVLLASVLYDRGSGFLASGLSILAMASQLDWRADPVGNLAALVIFAIVASFIAVFCEALRKALERGAAPSRAKTTARGAASSYEKCSGPTFLDDHAAGPFSSKSTGSDSFGKRGRTPACLRKRSRSAPICDRRSDSPHAGIS